MAYFSIFVAKFGISNGNFPQCQIVAIVISMDFGNRFFKLDLKICVCHNFFFIPFALNLESISKSLNLGTY